MIQFLVQLERGNAPDDFFTSSLYIHSTKSRPGSSIGWTNNPLQWLGDVWAASQLSFSNSLNFSVFDSCYGVLSVNFWTQQAQIIKSKLLHEQKSLRLMNAEMEDVIAACAFHLLDRELWVLICQEANSMSSSKQKVRTQPYQWHKIHQGYSWFGWNEKWY